MDLDNKILKYKEKKKKITNKINDLIEKKKKENINIITKIFHKTNEFTEIINKIIIGKIKNFDKIFPYKKNIFLIVTGFNFVGKSTFIDQLENYFGDSYTGSKINIKSVEELNILNNFIDNGENKFIYIETNTDLIEKIYNIILNDFNLNKDLELDKYVYIYNIIPRSVQVYKNRLINKVFSLLKKYSMKDYNLDTIDKNKFILDIGINNLSTDIFDKLNNKFPLSDDDFGFLDNFVNKSYDDIINYQSNKLEIKINIVNYYF